MPAFPEPSESEIQKSVLDYLLIRGHFCWRNNSGVFTGEHKGKKRFIRAGVVGSSDILGVEKATGRFIAIEVKRKGQKPTPAQIQFLADICERGGIGFWANCLEDVIRFGL